MSQDKNPPVMDHDYDGIQEFDNPLPMWWLVTFFITIIFGFLYWIHYEFGGGQNLTQELNAEMKQIELVQKTNTPQTESEEDLKKVAATGGNDLTSAKSIFDSKCAACHGKNLEGGIGPNLTDEYWIHGKGQLTTMAEVIRKGVLDKGMPPWEAQLKNEEVQALIALIVNSKGSNPAGAKPPQGDKVAN